MKPLTGDMHMHTLASGHAYGTIREMAQSAAAHQMELIGITEHGPGIPGTCDPFYFCNFEVIPKELYGVRVYLFHLKKDGSKGWIMASPVSIRYAMTMPAGKRTLTILSHACGIQRSGSFLIPMMTGLLLTMNGWFAPRRRLTLPLS